MNITQLIEAIGGVRVTSHSFIFQNLLDNQKVPYFCAPYPTGFRDAWVPYPRLVASIKTTAGDNIPYVYWPDGDDAPITGRFIEIANVQKIHHEEWLLYVRPTPPKPDVPMAFDFIKFLELLVAEFPYSTMRATFRGNHSLTLSQKRDSAALLLWSHDRAYLWDVDRNDFAKTPEALVAEIKVKMDKRLEERALLKAEPVAV